MPYYLCPVPYYLCIEPYYLCPVPCPVRCALCAPCPVRPVPCALVAPKGPVASTYALPVVPGYYPSPTGLASTYGAARALRWHVPKTARGAP